MVLGVRPSVVFKQLYTTSLIRLIRPHDKAIPSHTLLLSLLPLHSFISIILSPIVKFLSINTLYREFVIIISSLVCPYLSPPMALPVFPW